MRGLKEQFIQFIFIFSHVNGKKLQPEMQFRTFYLEHFLFYSTSNTQSTFHMAYFFNVSLGDVILVGKEKGTIVGKIGFFY